MDKPSLGGRPLSLGSIPSNLGGRPSSVGPLRVRKSENIQPSTSRQSLVNGRLSTSSNCSIGTRGGKSVSRYSAYPTSSQNQKKRQSSGIGIRGRTDVPKDPRAISDKGFQHKMIKQLLETLSERGYQYPISQKILQAPASKEFFKIFQFLYRHLDPKYDIGPKPEEEIPRIFKVLGYPFAISKSSMFAIGSPHTWPHLLAALVWLVEVIKCGGTMSENINNLLFPLEEDFESISEQNLLFDYCEKCYKAFLSGADEYDQYDEELTLLLKEKYQGKDGGIDSMIAENTRLQMEIEQFEQDGNHLVDLKDKHEVIDGDLTRLHVYMEEMSLYQRKLETQVKELDEDNTGLEADLKGCDLKIKQMNSIYETQNLTPVDVDRIKVNRQELQRQIDSLEADIEDVDKMNWKEEMDKTKSTQMLEMKGKEYNNLASVMKLIPITAEHSSGIDYELKTSYHKTMSADVDGILKPALMQLKKQYNSNFIEKMAHLLELQHSDEQMSELVVGQQEVVSGLEKTLKKADEDYQTEKEQFQKNIQHLQEEVDEKQESVSSQKRSIHLSLQEALKEYKDVAKMAEVRKAEMSEEQRCTANFVETVVKLIVDHRSDLQEKFQEILQDSTDLQRKTREETEAMLRRDAAE